MRECYLARKMNQLLTHETIWMGLEIIMPENTYCIIPFK